MNYEIIESFIIDYIQREYSISSGEDIHRFNFVKSGYIDSIGLIQFIAILEDEFNISFSDEELSSEEIQTVDSLTNLILQKKEKANETRKY